MHPLFERSGRELEAALERDPYDAATLLVYADWLREKGDPRGELAALQAGTESNHRLLPELVAFEEAHPELVPTYRAQLRWLHGFIQRAEVNTDNAEELVRHPSSRFLAELAVRADVDRKPAGQQPTHFDLDPLFALLELRRRPLRVLELDGDHERFCWRADLDLSWATQLESLALHGSFEARRFNAPRLRHLKLASLRTTPSMIRAAAEASWPSLTRLELWGGYTSVRTHEEIGELLANTPLPALESLTLRHTRESIRVLERLQRSPVLSGLRELDLARSSFTTAHAALITTSCHNLERLDITGHLLSPRDLERLRKTVRQVIG